MKTFAKRCGLVTASALLAGQLAFAQSSDFLGEWKNVDAETGGITRFVVTSSGTSGDTLNIQTFGSCSPTECDWGSTDLHLYGANVSDSNYQFGKAQYDSKFAERVMTMEFMDDQRMTLDAFTRFYAGTRHNYHSYDTFRKASGSTDTCQGPDLVVSYIEPPVYDNGSVIRATIENIGSDIAGPSLARLIDPGTLQPTGAPENAVASVPTLSPGESYTVTFMLDYWIYNPDADFEVTADYKGQVQECLENNNMDEFHDIG